MQQQCTTALKNAKKINKSGLNKKKSDLTQKKSDFFDFLLKIMIVSNPAGCCRIQSVWNCSHACHLHVLCLLSCSGLL